MEKRPVSLTIIAWVLIVLSVLGLISMFALTAANPMLQEKLAEMHVPMAFLEIWTVLGTVVTLICAYGILKGMPWSRVLYVVWGIIGMVVGFYITPQKASIIISLVVLVVVSIFLFGEKANVWFQARGFMLHRESMPEGRELGSTDRLGR
ncbi:hypothetical protein [Sphingomonas sp.]|uniref:hypothetical protein n=1 Tax=Sphingomonas sp. TaxID=28214 RepID=UPI0025CB7DF7|nr:hypothetical protein [Sphingomonas sp.]MBV9527307.1 hypothetical protein [Sphingomonas sp.]